MDVNCNSKLKQFFKNSVNLIRVQILLVDCQKTALQKNNKAHNRYHFRLCAFLCAFCSLISLLRIPRLITFQNKEDFSASISKVSSTMKVTLKINYLLFRLSLR